MTDVVHCQRKNYKRTIALFISFVLVSGCATYDHGHDEEKLMQSRVAYVQANPTLDPKIRQAILSGNLMVGMTKEQVISVLGQPDKNIDSSHYQFGETENWTYWRYPVDPEVMYLYTATTQSEACIEYSLTFLDGLLNYWNHSQNCQGIRDTR